jgi:hypothetical protein
MESKAVMQNDRTPKKVSSKELEHKNRTLLDEIVKLKAKFAVAKSELLDGVCNVCEKAQSS